MKPSFATIAIGLLAMASAAYGQVSLPPPAEKKSSEPFYAPYTGPGFGNPSESQSQSVGRARKQYNDASGAPAYSRGGNPGPTQPGDKPRKPKNKKTDESAKQAPVGDKR